MIFERKNWRFLRLVATKPFLADIFKQKKVGHKASFPCIKCYRELLIKWFYRLTVKESIEVSQVEK